MEQLNIATLAVGLTCMLSPDKKSLIILGNLPFDGEEGFSEEAEGSSYFIPLKARGAEGLLHIVSGKKASKTDPLTLADFGEFDSMGRNPVYAALPVIKDGKKDMYVRTDGSLTTDPYSDAFRRNIKKDVVQVPVQATPKRMYRVNVADKSLVWNDGKVRKLAIEIKANNPLTPEEFEATKSQASQRRQTTNVQRVLAEDSTVLANAVIARLVAQKKPNSAIRMVLEAQNLPVPEEYLGD